MIPRIQSNQMTLMAVFRVSVLPVIIPLVEVAVLANGIGMQAVYLVLFHLKDVVRLANDTMCLQDIGFQFADNGEIGSTTIAGNTMITLVGDILILWRGTGCRDEFPRMMGVFDEPSVTKSIGSFHQG